MENSFGKYLVKLRNQKAISQRKLAELAGVTNSTISRLEADLVTPDLKTLEKLANALGIDKTLLLTKCGYSEIPEEFVIIARKTGELSEEQKHIEYLMIPLINFFLMMTTMRRISYALQLGENYLLSVFNIIRT